jgi:hypothetical protein
VRWQPWAAGAAIAVLLAASAVALHAAHAARSAQPLSRRQLTGDPAVISAGSACGWSDLFPAKLDQVLAAYAQPGWIALPPEIAKADEAQFAEELARPMSTSGANTPERRTMARIVAAMRDEMKAYLDEGGKVSEYLEFLEERQDQERDFRNKALDAIARAPELMRERYRKNVNVRLREMGLPEAEAE